MERNKQVLLLSEAIEKSFNSSNWSEIGLLTSTRSWIDNHYRLLRSLRFQDDDYKEHVIDAVEWMFDAGAENANALVGYEPIVKWLEKNNPSGLEEIRNHLYGLEQSPLVETSSQSAIAALADAQSLIETRGPTRAVDRVHTSLHGFLKHACEELYNASHSGSFTIPKEPTANQLLKILLSNHPAFSNSGPREDDVRQIIQTSMAIVDRLGTLRNQASPVHPTVELLGKDEAFLVINIARSLLRYLDAKLGSI